MRGTVQIGDTQVEMLANAASPFLYRKIFKKDFLLEMDPSKDIDTNAITEMGFVMHMQTQKTFKEIIDTVTVEDFYGWLMQYEALDVPLASGDIFALFKGQEKTLSTQKKSRRKRRGSRRQRS